MEEFTEKVFRSVPLWPEGASAGQLAYWLTPWGRLSRLESVVIALAALKEAGRVVDRLDAEGVRRWTLREAN